MATEYISRDSVLEFLMVWNNVEDYNWGEKNIIGAAIQMVEDIPTADVQPVVRAAWLTGNDNPRTFGRIRAMCGRCGAFALYEMVNAGSYKEKQSNFCPNCGADMRPEGREQAVKMWNRRAEK